MWEIAASCSRWEEHCDRTLGVYGSCLEDAAGDARTGSSHEFEKALTAAAAAAAADAGTAAGVAGGCRAAVELSGASSNISVKPSVRICVSPVPFNASAES